jgi:hypothetical protein
MLCDMVDWPLEGPGWVTVSGADALADVLVASHEALDLPLGLPLVMVPRHDTPATLTDRAEATLFIDDAPEVIGAMLQRVCSGPESGLRERGDGAAMITALSQEAARIADALARLAEERGDGERVEGGGAVLPVAIDARLVRAVIKLRRDRERHFPAEIFADPAWDMMLDLAAARLEGQRVSVSSLCIASAVPTTTALRWIRSLSEAGIFQRRTDENDARRTWIALSDAASEAVMAWLRRFAAVFAPV